MKYLSPAVVCEILNSWLCGKVKEPPAWFDTPVEDPETVEILCEIASERVWNGVIFDGNRIVEIKPWGVSEKEEKDFNDWAEGRIDLHPDWLDPKNLPDEMQPFENLSGWFWQRLLKKNIRKKLESKQKCAEFLLVRLIIYHYITK